MFLSINQNIGNFLNNALQYLNRKTVTEKSTKEQEETTDELNPFLIESIEQNTLVAEEQDLNNSNIQRDLKAEFLKIVVYSSYHSGFIEKFLDNPKFRNVLTKRVENQDLSEIEAMLLNSITKHLELLSSFESFGDYYYRFLADPLKEQYFPEREDFKTEKEYLKCVQEYEKEQAKASEKFEARYQEYETLIAASLTQIEQQLN